MMFGVFPTHMGDSQVRLQPLAIINYITSCSNVFLD